MLPAPAVEISEYPDPRDPSRVVRGLRLLRPLHVPLVIDRWPEPYCAMAVVPEGYVSDGASVPRLLWRLLSPPIDPVTLAPSIVHDWLYDNGASLGLTRIEADAWYADALHQHGYPAWKCLLTYAGTRLGGGSRWNPVGCGEARPVR